MKKILIIVTSHDQLGNTGRKTGLWLEEFTTPYYLFLDGGYQVAVGSPKGGKAPIDPLSLEPGAASDSTRLFERHQETVLDHTIPLQALKGVEFDALFYPGGHGPMWDLPQDQDNIDILTAMSDQNKIIGAVCHGPAALLGAKRSNGEAIICERRVTGFSDAEEDKIGLSEVVPFLLQDRMMKLGGIYSKVEPWKPHVVLAGNLVTGQNPQSAQGVGEAIATLLELD